MTATSGESVTISVKIGPGHIDAAVLTGTSCPKVTCARPMCQVYTVPCRHSEPLQLNVYI